MISCRIISFFELAHLLTFSKLYVILLIIFRWVSSALWMVMLCIACLKLYIALALPTCISLTYHTKARLINNGSSWPSKSVPASAFILAFIAINNLGFRDRVIAVLDRITIVVLDDGSQLRYLMVDTSDCHLLTRLIACRMVWEAFWIKVDLFFRLFRIRQRQVRNVAVSFLRIVCFFRRV